MTIAVDFDGTIVEHKYPAIGREKPFAIDALKQLSAQGHRIILWTAREGQYLEEAVDFCKKRGLTFYAVNSNYPAGYLFEHSARNTTKVVADIYIDDHNLGGLPEWSEIYRMIAGEAYRRSSKKRSWWQRIFKPGE